MDMLSRYNYQLIVVLTHLQISVPHLSVLQSLDSSYNVPLPVSLKNTFHYFPTFLYTLQAAVITLKFEQPHEKICCCYIAYAKTKGQISCSVTVQLISAFVTFGYIDSTIPLLPKYKIPSL